MAKAQEEVRQANSVLELVDEVRVVGFASRVHSVLHADVLIFELGVHTVVEELADGAVGAREGDAAYVSRDLSALDAGVAEVAKVGVEVVALDGAGDIVVGTA